MSTERLMARARWAGYVLQRSPVWPWDWLLFDAEDGMPIYSARDLESTRRWLNE